MKMRIFKTVISSMRVEVNLLRRDGDVDVLAKLEQSKYDVLKYDVLAADFVTILLLPSPSLIFRTFNLPSFMIWDL